MPARRIGIWPTVQRLAWQNNSISGQGATQGVGEAATRSVGAALILLITANVVLVRLIFFMFPEGA